MTRVVDPDDPANRATMAILGPRIHRLQNILIQALEHLEPCPHGPGQWNTCLDCTAEQLACLLVLEYRVNA